MSAKLTISEQNEIINVLLNASREIINLVNKNIDDAYQDGYKNGVLETEDKYKIDEQKGGDRIGALLKG